MNRASIGTSRYLDLVDGTGKYSSTNIFADDGALWYVNGTPAFQFNWLTTTDISNAVTNQVAPLTLNAEFQQFYYANFPRPDLTALNYTWHSSTLITNENTGYFQNSLGNPVAVGQYTSNNGKYITVGSLVKFVPPTGYYFDSSNNLKIGSPTGPNESLVLWASPTAVYLDGTAQGLGNLPSGIGPVVFNTYIPTGAIPAQVIPTFTTDLPTSVQQAIFNQIYLKQNFGVGYNNLTNTWYVITSTNLDTNAAFSLQNAQDTSGTGIDASWLIQCTYNASSYTVISRALDYYFGSVLDTRFFFYTNEPIYDSRTGTVIKDFINVLSINTAPGSTSALPSDNVLTIINQPVLSDGLVDDFQVEVSFSDVNDLTPVNPDFFANITGSWPGLYNAQLNSTPSPYVFFQATVDFDNLERYLLINEGVVNYDYPTLASIQAVQDNYTVGQVFYAYQDQVFYSLGVTLSGDAVLTVNTSYQATVGRQGLKFQYRHNSPLTSRIDPGSTNIIDLYVVTNDYYTAYQNWLLDTTGTVQKPSVPTIDQLTTAYAGLQNYQMISDNVILNSVDFQPLFGQKADPALRATIKVIASSQTTASASTIQSLVIANMNAYFNLDAWNFGDTFYFSELAAYIHQNIGNIVSSVVLVPLDPSKSFGDLYEIRSAPNQIFCNGATVNDVQVITALTSANLQTAPGSGVI